MVRGSWSRRLSRCSELDGRKALAISAWRLNYLIRLRNKKEAPTPFRGKVEAKVYAPFGRMGDDPRPLPCQAQTYLTASRFLAK